MERLARALSTAAVAALCAACGRPAPRVVAAPDPDASAPTPNPDASDLEREERACDEARGKLAAKLDAARACTRDVDCVTLLAACVAPCGRAVSAARAAELKPEIDALRLRCEQRCGKVKCAAWSGGAPGCRGGTCEIPR